MNKLLLPALVLPALAIALAPRPVLAAEPPALEPGDLVAVCGDSITEQKIYSAYIETYLLACQPAPNLEASQFGWGGETSWGFAERMANDVLPFKPDVATLCYGMNDGDYSKVNPERVEKYRDAVLDVVRQLKAAGVREIVVGSPGPVDSDAFKGVWFRPLAAADYNETLAALAQAASEAAESEGVRFANLHAAGMEVMEAIKAKYGKEYYLFGDDGIHPKEAGHLVMAYAFLKALGCEGQIGSIELDAATGKATADAGHSIDSSEDGVVRITSTRYPFCFEGNPAEPNATSGVIEFLPFNADLNRLTLVVKNLPEGVDQASITWGDQTREFTAEDLAAGVNLAEAFLQNPFSAAFKQVHEAVLRQQRFETPAMKDMIHSVPGWRQHDVEGDFAGFVTGLIKMDENLRNAAAESVRPVTHEIRVQY